MWPVSSCVMLVVYLLHQTEDITNYYYQGLEQWLGAIFNSLGVTAFLSFGTSKFVWRGRCMFFSVCSMTKAASDKVSLFIAVMYLNKKSQNISNDKNIKKNTVHDICIWMKDTLEHGGNNSHNDFTLLHTFPCYRTHVFQLLALQNNLEPPTGP